MLKRGILLLAVVMLSGCGQQKSHQEFIDDIHRISDRYNECVASKVAKEGDVFCQYVLDAPDDMAKFIKLGIRDPNSLGNIILTLQQEIGELQVNIDENRQELESKQLKLRKCYLVLKMLSSIK